MTDVVRIDPNAELMPDPDNEGHRLSVQFHGSDPGLSVGVWSAGELSDRFDAYPADEVCVVLEGTITLTLSDGTVHTFERGDVFALRKGAALHWEQTAGTRKIFVVLQA